MKLINIYKQKPVIDPVALLINEFKEIWNRDKSKDKNTALEELAYIFFYTDYMSPYKIHIESKRGDAVKKDVIKDETWEPDEAITAAIEKYKELQKTPSIGILEDAETSVEKLRQYFRETDITRSRDGVGAKNLIMNLKQVGDLVKSIRTLRELVEKEQYELKAVRGGGSLGSREMPPDERV